VTDSASSFHQTTTAPIIAWASTMTTAAAAVTRTARRCPVRQAATASRATSTTTIPATARCECSIQAWTLAGGTSLP
jgi:hypothetical protein